MNRLELIAYLTDLPHSERFRSVNPVVVDEEGTVVNDEADFQILYVHSAVDGDTFVDPDFLDSEGKQGLKHFPIRCSSDCVPQKRLVVFEE